MLTFEPAAHHYFWNGRRVPNVTSIIGHLTDYSRIPPDKLEIARQKGVAVHKMVELDAQGREFDLPEWMQPAFEQWRKFKAEVGFRLIDSEKKVYHPVYGYAGTLDLYAELTHAAVLAFIDVKRSFLAGTVIGVQLAAYKEAHIAQEGDKAAKKAKRYALRLNENTPYRVEQYPDESQFQDFLTCLAHLRVKEKYQ